MSEKLIDDVFGSEEEVTEIPLDEVNVKSEGTKIDLNSDYNFVRENLIRSIIRASELIDGSIREAKNDPNPRAVEAAATVVKTLTEASKSLLDLHEKIRNINKELKDSSETEDEDEGIVLRTTLTDLISKIDTAQNE